jgi:hypothetical protein
MSFTLGDAVVNFKADNRALIKSLKDTKRRLKTDFSAMAKSFTIVTGAISAGAAVLTGFGVTAARHFGKFGEDLANISTRLGISAQRMAELHLITKTSGISIAMFNTALQRMGRRVGEASVGMGEAKDALAELGLDAVSLSEMSIDEQFMKIAEALNAVEKDSDKLRLAFKVFDSEGIGVLQVIGKGVDKLEQLKQKANEFGLVMDDEGIKKASEMNEAVVLMKEAFSGMVLAIGELIAPAVEQGANLFQNFFTRIKDLIDTNSSTFSEWIERIADFFMNLDIDLDTNFENIDQTVESVVESISGFFTHLAEGGEIAKKMFMDISEFIFKHEKEIKGAIKDVSALTIAVKNVFNGLAAPFRLLDSFMKNILQGVEKVYNWYLKLDRLIQRYAGNKGNLGVGPRLGDRTRQLIEQGTIGADGSGTGRGVFSNEGAAAAQRELDRINNQTSLGNPNNFNLGNPDNFSLGKSVKNEVQLNASFPNVTSGEEAERAMLGVLKRLQRKNEIEGLTIASGV